MDDIVEPLENNKMLVMVNGSVGVVSYDGQKFSCSVCSLSYCRHAGHLKKMKAEGNYDNEHTDFFSQKQCSRVVKDGPHAVSKKKIPFIPTQNMKKFLRDQFHENEVHENEVIIFKECVKCCSESESKENYTHAKVFTKSAIHKCKGW